MVQKNNKNINERECNNTNPNYLHPGTFATKNSYLIHKKR